MLFPVRGGPSCSRCEPQPTSCSTSRGASRVMTKCNALKNQTVLHIIATRHHCFCTPKYCRLQKCGWMSASMKWRYLGCLQLLSKAVAEMEVSPQEEMANPQGMKVIAIERPGLPEDFVYFPDLCGVQSSPLVFAPNLPIVWGPLQW